MHTAAKVILWGTQIGTVSTDDSTRGARFQYTEQFLHSGIEVSPIVMPLSGQIYTFPALAEDSFRGLPGLLADSLPDRFGNAVIDAWLASQGRLPGSMNAVERLCYTGSRGMGALEYVPDIAASRDPGENVEIGKLTELAAAVLSQRKEILLSETEGMEQMIRVGTSAGGARAKAVIAWNEKTGEIRSGQIPAGTGFGYWLLKFDGLNNNRDKEETDAPGYTRIEYAYYLMAQAAGISMSECRLYKEGERYHFLTRRFDRNPQTGEKIHMQSLGAIAHYDYNLPGAYSYEQASQILLRLDLGHKAVSQLYRRMLFNVMARNQDDHVKNISFLMDKRGKWSLAPAYDLTYAYNPGGLWTGRHQMSINGKREKFEAADLFASGKNMNLKPKEMKEFFSAVRDAIISWPQFAEQAGVKEADMEAVRKAQLYF